MSPNEFQLRSALRDGEGEHVNPDTVIARARGVQQARHDRRVRYGSVAAAVAIVGGIGVTGGVVLSGGGAHHDSASANEGGTNYSAGQAAGGGRAAASGSAAAKGGVSSKPVAPVPEPAAAVIPCPESPPRLMLPGGGGSGQFGAQGPLFSDPIEAVKVCAYTSHATNVVPSTVLTGGAATNLITSLEQADKTLSGSIKCPGASVPVAGGARTLVIIAVDKDGRQLKPVVVTLGCPTRVTNGTALRFNWTPPANVAKLIYTLPISLPPSGKVIGSPINS